MGRQVCLTMPELAIAPMFEVVSASFTKLASLLFLEAFKICCFFLSAFGKDLSSVSSATMLAISLPKRASNSATEVGGLSSTKSCSRAAAMALFYYNPIQVSICLIESRRGMFT